MAILSIAYLDYLRMRNWAMSSALFSPVVLTPRTFALDLSSSTVHLSSDLRLCLFLQPLFIDDDGLPPDDGIGSSNDCNFDESDDDGFNL